MSVKKGIRLYLRKAWENHASTWIIRDGSRQVSTGCAGHEIEQAQIALSEYIAKNHKPERLEEGKREPRSIAVADVLLLYMQEKFDKLPPRQSEKAISRFKKLTEYFGDKTLGHLNKTACRAYVTWRMDGQRAEEARRAKQFKRDAKAPTFSSSRRELSDLRAAINFYFSDELIPPKINIELPEKDAVRERWLTVPEAAKLLRTAWRRSQPMPKGGKRFVSRHIARFILVGLYTGTRASAICEAAIRPTEGRGYVDLDRGVFYRRAPGSAESTKRRPPVRLPRKLLSHMRRWARLGLCDTCVVEWEGKPVLSVGKGFREIVKAAKLLKVTPHTLRHTAITWALQGGAKRFDVADYFGVSEKVIERTYGHHDPAHHSEVTSRMDSRHRPDAEPVSQPVSAEISRARTFGIR